MIYLCNPSTQSIRDAMSAGEFACITTPAQHNLVPPGAYYACDNGRYGSGWPGGKIWWAWLTRQIARFGAERCLFATAPDVVGDAQATLAESLPWLGPMRALGVPVAFVAQDGSNGAGLIPWDHFDVLFIGGTTEFKLTAGDLCAEAIRRGKRVHMGRVNSRRRLRIAAEFGCESADGTYMAFGPDLNLGRMRRWLGEVNA